ncbi:L-cysteine desulfidase family protein [Qiania dongpingensis]|uniref:UPF0597 protein H9Q78_08445 n=1 Tax=Qiania dongpingensis TaxID=2763669 RepID=A0A7G9G122_9FIRM|nr:L-serine ammonia-lyase, iron-sulfur-dependent, subunit alpha [Qiania dongpingensis]QNM04504.1 serine dehydratase subunit alpha family protein [Qiania dongpingensis]
MNKSSYNNYVSILRSELLPALGCTEPIAIAYCAAKARQTLGCMPDMVSVACSGNIIKNVKGVTVPNSGGLKGVEAAAVLGIIGGDAEKELEVLEHVSGRDIEETEAFLKTGKCTVSLQEGEENLYVMCTLKSGTDTASVELKTKHNHISKIEKNGKVIFSQPDVVTEEAGNKKLLNLEEIYEFANCVKIDDVKEVIERQIQMNMAIAEEGVQNSWGVNVGAECLKMSGDDTLRRAEALAAAGSDARMSGCPMPVVINSGSGNQGITLTAPVVTYAKDLKVSGEKLIRAMVLANLISIHQKRFIGNLSAYCGATSAATAAACGVAYLYDESMEVISNTIINSIATIGGMVCDGAKPSCAAKIRSAVDTAMLAYRLAKDGRVYQSGEGLVEKDAETTIRNVGRMGRVGMASTDVEILNIMIGQ